MITSDGMLEVQEQEDGTYVFPNSKKFKPTWALYIFKDGRAQFFTKRKETGALLGKPQEFPIPPSLALALDDIFSLCDNANELEKLINTKSGKRFKVVFAEEHQMCDDTVCPLKFKEPFVPHRFGPGCRFYKAL